MKRLKPYGLFGLLAALAGPAVAALDENDRQSAPAATSPDAATASGTPALAGYRRFSVDEPLRDWRAVNAEVGRLKGHGGHLRDAPKPPGEAPQNGHAEPQ